MADHNSKVPMTCMERVLLAAKGKEADRIPILPFGLQFQVKQAGYKLSECLADISKYINAQVYSQQRFGYDAIWSFGGIPGLIDLSMAPNIVIPDDDMPYIDRPYYLEEPLPIDKIYFPSNPWQDSKMITNLEIVRTLRKNASVNGIPVIGRVTFPFRICCILRGFAEFYLDIIERPEWALQLLEAVTEADIRFMKALVEAGADLIQFFDPVASGDCLSREQYEKFAFPYESRVAKAAKPAGAKATIFHFCGDNRDRWDLAAKVGVDILTLDRGDLAEAKRMVSNEVCIMGNIPIMDIMLLGTTRDVERIALKLIRDVGVGGGYIMAGSCHIPRDTPVENFEVLMNTVKKYGTYPVDIDKINSRIKMLTPYQSSMGLAMGE